MKLSVVLPIKLSELMNLRFVSLGFRNANHHENTVMLQC